MSEERTVKDGFVDTVLKQIDTDDPPEARATYDRLIDQGLSNSETLHLMSASLRVVMTQMLEQSKPFDTRQYVELLKKLPAL